MKRRGIASKERSQLVVENFYDLLPWRNTANNCFTQRFLPDASNEFSCDLKIDIRFEQRQAHLTQSSVDIRFADNPMPTELFENFLKFVAKLWKHHHRRSASSRPTFECTTARVQIISLALPLLLLVAPRRLLRFRTSNAPRPFCPQIS